MNEFLKGFKFLISLWTTALILFLGIWFVLIGPMLIAHYLFPDWFFVGLFLWMIFASTAGWLYLLVNKHVILPMIRGWFQFTVFYEMFNIEKRNEQ